MARADDASSDLVAEGNDALSAREWPVPWQPVWGSARGFGSHLGSWAVRCALAGCARLPAGAVDAMLAGLAALATRFDRRRREATREFLCQALGPLDEPEIERRTRQAWLHLLRMTADTQRFFARVPPGEVAAHHEVVWSDDARAAQRARRGCLIVTGHLGNWEAALALAPWIGWHPVYGVAKPPKNRPLSRAIQESRERRGLRILNRKGAMRSAPEILRAGGTLCMVVDQRASGRALLAPFFGRLARCDRSPGVLLKRLKVPIVIGHSLMGTEPLTYRTTFGEVLWPEQWAGAEVEEIARRINQALELLILAHPEQYVWIHDRYKDTPRELAPGARGRILRTPIPGSDT